MDMNGASKGRMSRFAISMESYCFIIYPQISMYFVFYTQNFFFLVPIFLIIQPLLLVVIFLFQSVSYRLQHQTAIKPENWGRCVTEQELCK